MGRFCNFSFKAKISSNEFAFFNSLKIAARRFEYLLTSFLRFNSRSSIPFFAILFL